MTPMTTHLAVKIATYPEVIGLTELFLTHRVAHHWQWLWVERAPQATPELATLTFEARWLNSGDTSVPIPCHYI